MEKFEKNKGITLIALIITIIVLLILAGVAIATLTGENGILTKATEASEQTKIAKEKEEISIAYTAIIGEKLEKGVLASVLQSELDKMAKTKVTDNNDGTLNVEFEDTKNNYNLDNGKIEKRGKWYIEKNNNGKNTIITDGIVSLKIGDYVNYNYLDGASYFTYVSKMEKNGYADQTYTIDSSESIQWKVMGVTSLGELVITTKNGISPSDGGYVSNGVSYYALKGMDGYKNAIEELDNISKLYGQGYGAINARSINLYDVNKITGYNPNNVGIYNLDQITIGTKYKQGTLQEYGNEITYFWNGTDHPYYTSKNAMSGNIELNMAEEYYKTSYSKGFAWFDETLKSWLCSNISNTATTEKKEKIITLKNTAYFYYFTTLTDKSSDPNNGLISNSAEFILLAADKRYWLADRAVINSYDRTILLYLFSW